jgi:hypothetical protein
MKTAMKRAMMTTMMKATIAAMMTAAMSTRRPGTGDGEDRRLRTKDGGLKTSTRNSST